MIKLGYTVNINHKVNLAGEEYIIKSEAEVIDIKTGYVCVQYANGKQRWYEKRECREKLYR